MYSASFVGTLRFTSQTALKVEQKRVQGTALGVHPGISHTCGIVLKPYEPDSTA